MAKFRYESINKNGKAVDGVIDADSRRGAARKLREEGLFPTSIAGEKETAGIRKAGIVEAPAVTSILGRAINVPFFSRPAKMSPQDLAVFFRQWSSLISSGIPLIRSLSCLIDQEEKEGIKKVLEEIREKIQSGSTLADALSGHREVFSQLQIDMIKAGEIGGMLEMSLVRLADFTEADQDLRERVRSALMYPILLIVVMVGAVGFLLAFVVPRFVDFFSDIQQSLPVPTLILIGLGNFMSRAWWILILIAFAAAFAYKSYADTDSGKLKVDRIKLRMPLLGPLIRKVVVSRFTRTLSTLVEGGIAILSALDIAKNTTGNLAVTQALEEVKTSVREGESIAEPIRRTNEFPPLVIHMIAVGEEGGRLGEMLLRVSEVYDNEVSTAIKRLTGILEPAIILVLSVVVGFVVLAVLLPILSMNLVGG